MNASDDLEYVGSVVSGVSGLMQVRIGVAYEAVTGHPIYYTDYVDHSKTVSLCLYVHCTPNEFLAFNGMDFLGAQIKRTEGDGRVFYSIACTSCGGMDEAGSVYLLGYRVELYLIDGLLDRLVNHECK